MIELKAKTSFDGKRVLRAAKKGSFKSLEHAAGYVRKVAANSIKVDRTKKKKPSKPGTPPRTRGNRRLKNAIKYAVDSVSAIVGPDAAVAGNVGKAHEFGGKFRDEEYPKRPFMGPALAKSRDRLPEFWRSSVK